MRPRRRKNTKADPARQRDGTVGQQENRPSLHDHQRPHLQLGHHARHQRELLGRFDLLGQRQDEPVPQRLLPEVAAWRRSLTALPVRQALPAPHYGSSYPRPAPSRSK
jgi:hypothetical protein